MTPLVCHGLFLLLAPAFAPPWSTMADAGSVIASPEDEVSVSVVGGEETPAGTYESVVMVRAGGNLCSGVMVDESYLLTAAHCVDGLGAAEPVAVAFGARPQPADTQPASEWGVHPDYCRDCGTLRWDFAYVRLQTPGPVSGEIGVPVASSADWNSLMHLGESVTMVGYGYDAVGGEVGVRHSAQAELLGSMHQGREFAVGGGGAGACEGDSGGPVMGVLPDGSQRVVGIIASTYSCGGETVMATPLPALCWLRDETGVDLLPSTCTDCDCVDFDEADGCACASGGASAPRTLGWAAALTLLLPVLRGRRRSHAA